MIKMSNTTIPRINNGFLMVSDKVLLSNVPDNVVVKPVSDGSAFIGASSESPSARQVFSLGVLRRYRFLSLYRFNLWWMIPFFGNSGQEVPVETQMLLFEGREDPATTDNTFYILLLPHLDGQFRCSLQGTRDPDVQTSQVLEGIFINSGDNPYKLMRNSIKILERQKGFFRHIDNNKLPAHLDWFLWNTWDAFYKKVDPEGIEEGLTSFAEAGCTPRVLTIDDGWQNAVTGDLKDEESTENAKFVLTKLVNLVENSKFNSLSGKSYANLREFIRYIREKYGLKYVCMWHGLLGDWGGVLPTSEDIKKYNPKLAYPTPSPGILSHGICVTLDSIIKRGIGIIDPSKIDEFYDDFHGYLASCGVDGVKVDVMNTFEMLASGYGGRVSLTRCYREAVEKSVRKHFKDNNLIFCLNHNTENIYSKQCAASRASEDFSPNEPTFQTLHVAAVAYNSILLGEIYVPDWDMFYSDHCTADFHAAARALGGCAVYVSDIPGSHNFNIIKKLALPDGSVLRARCAGRPTRDCLFIDPVTDGKSLLKIWNLNKFSGIIGVFNCQGTGTWPPIAGSQYASESTTSSISGHISPLDVDSLEEVAGENWHGECALYAFNSGSLHTMPKQANLEVSLGHVKHEIFTIPPIRVSHVNLRFAPIGLLDMYNSGGAIEAVNNANAPFGATITIQVRGCGRFGAYSNTTPLSCFVDQKEEEFMYNKEDGLLMINLQDECKSRNVEIAY